MVRQEQEATDACRTDEEYRAAFHRFTDDLFSYEGWDTLLQELGLSPVERSRDELEGEARTYREVIDRQLTPGSVKLLLDGQQHITSPYGIIRGKPPKFFGDASCAATDPNETDRWAASVFADFAYPG